MNKYIYFVQGHRFDIYSPDRESADESFNKLAKREHIEVRKYALFIGKSNQYGMEWKEFAGEFGSDE